MGTSRHLRLGNLESFAGALLLALGASPLVACASTVEGGGAGGGGGATDANATSTVGSTIGSSGGEDHGLAGCQNPTPLLLDDGTDSGIDLCDGYYRRRASIVCPEPPDLGDCCDGLCGDDEYCADEMEEGCRCKKRCATDADCGDGSICRCGYGNEVTCVPSDCRTADDCEAGQECTSYSRGPCTSPGFACTLPSDECHAGSDCSDRDCELDQDGSVCGCQPGSDGRQCVEVSDGDCGRPFLVDDTARTAAVARRGDWGSSGLPVSIVHDDASDRGALADAWTRIALMEHASIAAFARFALQLLALGAPLELIEQTHEAMRDETRHARLAFSLATRFRGEPVGPGPLALDGALVGADDVRDFVRLTIREGCIGETVAALEAGEAHAVAGDEAVRSVLAEIARDERAHAELAWSAVRWALDAFGDIARAVVREELAVVEQEVRAAATASPSSALVAVDALARHGIVGVETRAILKRETLGHVVEPCLRALLAARRGMPVEPASLAATV